MSIPTGLTPPPALAATLLRGLGWLGGAQGVRQVLQLCIRVLLIRLLTPRDFGLLGMATVVTGFLLMLNDLGLGPALVRKERVSDIELSTVFWLNLLTGCLLALATAALGPPLAWFNGQPELVPICCGLAGASLLAPLGAVHSALLQRRFAFRSLAAADLAGIGAGGAVAVGLAARGHGVWALVWQTNVTCGTVLLVTALAARWRPRRCCDRAAAAGLWQVSGCLTAASLLNYWTRNLDNLLIGRFLGAAALGYYSQAYQLMLYPVQNVAAVAGRVMLPALASLQADKERMRRLYLRALSGIASITFPLMLGAVIAAPDLYRVMFGPRWLPSVFLFQLLCGIGMLQSLGTTVGWIYLTTGRTDLHLRWNLIVAAVILPGFGISLWWGGLRGLTLGYALLAALLFAPSLLPPFRLISLPPLTATRRLLPLLTAAAGMALALAALRMGALTSLDPAPRLLIEMMAGAVLYPTLLHRMGQAPLARMQALWRALRGE